jgi:pimeloyl-ACP methyl ester carboxylesterase
MRVVRSHQPIRASWCVCIAALMAGGCVTFQQGPSERLAAAERVVLPGRGQLRVVEAGPKDAAETVLLVHGYGSSSASWRPILGELAARYRVLAVDLPGFGRSDRRDGDYTPQGLADALAAVLDARGVARAHVVGHSFGGSVVLAFALRHPERLAKLAVVSGWMYDEQLLPLMRWARVPGLGEALYALFYREALSERLYLNFADPSYVTQDAVEEVERQMAREGTVAAALAAARGMRYADWEASYRTIGVETLLLWGAEDRVSRPAFGERLARELPHARFQLLPACAHLPMWECRGATAAALRAFLDGAPAPDAVAQEQ